jgi:hypothetical protein
MTTKAQHTKVTLTQSEELKIGERGVFTPQVGCKFAANCEFLNITCWVEKRKKAPTPSDNALREFIEFPTGYELVYGITYQGTDHDCGDMPRDLSKVVNGILIARAAIARATT